MLKRLSLAVQVKRMTAIANTDRELLLGACCFSYYYAIKPVAKEVYANTDEENSWTFDQHDVNYA